MEQRDKKPSVSVDLYEELSRLNNELANMHRELAKKNVELQDLNKTLHFLNEEKNRFLGMAVHDLRKPLAIISMYSEFLHDSLSSNLNKDNQDFIATIMSSSKTMLGTINAFLDFSKIEAGRLELQLQPTDIAIPIKNTMKLNEIFANKKNITLSYVPHDTIPKILIDGNRIEQVLDNLVSNAIKFSRTDTNITIGLDKKDGFIIISVKDEGLGIPEQEIETLFNPYEKTSVKGTSGEQSTGLGLAIAKKIVIAHKGKIWVDSTEGAGSTFSFSLPLAQPD